MLKSHKASANPPAKAHGTIFAGLLAGAILLAALTRLPATEVLQSVKAVAGQQTSATLAAPASNSATTALSRVVRRVFVFTNAGSQTLTVSADQSASCCTEDPAPQSSAAAAAARPAKPGSLQQQPRDGTTSAKSPAAPPAGLVVTLESSSKVAHPFEVSIEHTPTSSPEGKVKPGSPALSIQPARVELPPGPLAQKLTRSIAVRNYAAKALELSELSLSIKGVEAKLIELEKGKFFNVILTFPEGFDRTNGQPMELSLKSNNPQFPLVRVPIVER